MSRDIEEKHARRVAWLKKHEPLWVDMPSKWMEIVHNETATQKFKFIVLMMKKAGVIPQHTYWQDINLVSLMNRIREGT